LLGKDRQFTCKSLKLPSFPWKRPWTDRGIDVVSHPVTTAIPHRYHSDTTAIPHRYHSDTTPIPQRYHSDTTLLPQLQSPFAYRKLFRNDAVVLSEDVITILLNPEMPLIIAFKNNIHQQFW
jgi:hypothetical protein